MNDVRKWAADVIDNAEPGDAEDDLARELLDFIGRDAEPDPWEVMAGKLREWMEAERTEMQTMFKRLASRDPSMAAAWSTRSHDMQRAIAKLDELEQKNR